MATRFVKRLFECSSTNDVAIQLARAEECDSAVVLSDRQKSGRGRQGRSWISTNHSLAISYVKQKNLTLQNLHRISLLTAMAIVDALHELAIPTQIKWPNDIWLPDGRKVAGILVETSISETKLDAAIIGIGINIFRSDNDDPLFGFLSDAGYKQDKEILVDNLLKYLDNYLNDINDNEKFAQCLTHHRQHSSILGKSIKTHDTNGQLISARAIDLDEKGALIVEHENGIRLTICAGEIISS